MININEVAETNEMIEKENLDVRTITMGISLLDCIDNDLDTLASIPTLSFPSTVITAFISLTS